MDNHGLVMLRQKNGSRQFRIKANAGERVAKINVKQMTTQMAAFLTLYSTPIYK